MHSDHPADVATDASALAQRTAAAANPTASVAGRTKDAIAAVTLGARLIPSAWRLMRRRPLVAAILAAAVVGVVYAARRGPGAGQDVLIS